MQAVPSYEPLTKRRPSGSSARHFTAFHRDVDQQWCLKVRRTVPIAGSSDQ
jgi:hypothetical protein